MPTPASGCCALEPRRGVAWPKVAAVDHGRCHRLEIRRATLDEIRRVRFRRRRRRTRTDDRQRLPVSGAQPAKATDSTPGSDGGGPQSASRSPAAGSPRVSVSIDEHVVVREAQRLLESRSNVATNRPAGDEQEHTERHLRGDQHVRQAPWHLRIVAPFERADRLRRRRAKCRRESEEQRDGHGERDAEAKRAPVDVEDQPDGPSGGASIETTSGADHEANSAPATEAATASSALSTSTSWISRQRPAPIETRSAISRARAAA